MRTAEEQQAHQAREKEIGDNPQPGHIYRTSWGYDQTNVEFFQVINRTAGTVTLRRIGAEVIDGRLWPLADVWVPDWHINSAQGKEDRNATPSDKVCHLATKARPYDNGIPRMGASLTIDDVRHAWPYVGGGAYETFAAGGAGH